jgi:hypothetical protein
MRRTLASLGGLFLLAAAGSAAPCTPSATSLCLSGGRFEVSVAWKDFQSHTGAGQAVSLTADTGYFWFFADSNVELIVKVLDARGINGKFWVFFGALSNIEYTMTVRDSVSGAVKTYRNPSGQFASVGDTVAFEGAAVAAASREAVVAAGTAAPAAAIADIRRWIVSPKAAAPPFTPCPDRNFGFDLTGCRFHIDVEWNDGRGNSGRGQPVQLTSDTGYFWFFSSSNVELVVKVLDARAIGGKFWVFFGALSNVEYRIIVSDSITGATRSYQNPSGTFASAGDTDAFPGGYSVVSVPDPDHAASAQLDHTGGSVTATGSDGTVFHLEIPPDALASPETVTLTPVSRIDRFPFSGGLVAGVEIEPAGLELMVPATLTIQPVASPPADRTLPYWYRRGGEDFILYPRDVDTSSLRLPLLKFGGYGAGLGDSAEAESQSKRRPAASTSPYLQRYAYEVLLRIRGQISQADLANRGSEIYREAYDQLVAPLFGPAALALVTVNPKRVGCDLTENPNTGRPLLIEGIVSTLGVEQQKQMLGIEVVDPETGEVLTGLQGVSALLQACQDDAFERCTSRNDPYEAAFMLAIARTLTLLGEEDPLRTTFAEGGLLERCLRFELDFESKIVDEFHGPSAISETQRLKYRAHVPLRFNYAGADNIHGRGLWEGGCTFAPEVASIEYIPPPPAACTVTVNPRNAWLDVPAAWLGTLSDPSKSAVKVLYDPGEPQVQASAACSEGVTLPNFPVFPFASDYLWLHDADRDDRYGIYLAMGWDQLRVGGGPSQNGEYFAKKSYERSKRVNSELTTSEETLLFLKHTPDAPMPACQ